MPSARLYFLLVFLLAIGLRLYFLHDPIFIDEATTYLDFARHPLAQALSDYHLPNNHLLHTLLLHLSLPVFGIEPWALRIPSLLPGLLLIPAVWRLASLWHSPAAAPLPPSSPPSPSPSFVTRSSPVVTLFRPSSSRFSSPIPC